MARILDEPDDFDAEFTFGLERVLDGIEALVRALLRSAASGSGRCGSVPGASGAEQGWRPRRPLRSLAAQPMKALCTRRSVRCLTR
jgi:hypothetical protein